MKAKNIVYLAINMCLAIVAFIFSFTNIFLEKTEMRYSITFGQSLFAFEPNVWVVFTIITLFCIMAVCIAMFVLYILLQKYGKKVFWKWYFALSLALCVLVVSFVIFAVNVCVSKSVFGFGQSTDYKFNWQCYVYIISMAGLGLINLFNALDFNKKLLK